MQKHYLVTFLQTIAVEAPEGTDTGVIMDEARKYMADNYHDVKDFIGDEGCSDIEEVGGEYHTKVRIIEEVMDDVDWGCDGCDESQVVITE